LDSLIFLAVLFAAACHAGWNALIKIGLDPLSTAALMAFGAGAVALAMLPAAGAPAPAAWPWLCGSVLVHLLYFAALTESYRAGDLGQVYPIARGAAPLMTAAVTTLGIGERLPPADWVGVIALVSGVVLLSARGGRNLAGIDRRAVGFALLTSLTICAYSVVDGIGVRLAGNAGAYSVWLFIGIGLSTMPYAFARGGRAALASMRGNWGRGLVGGAFQVVSYGIVLWAMTRAPIAIVAALRESSVLFGAAIAVLVLKEPLRAARIAAAALIVSGLVLMRLQ
jgi:drug/metabolite transporter (DMT)-like permease